LIDSFSEGGSVPSVNKRYLHGPAVDQILAQEDATDNEVLWHLTDNLGSVRDLVDNAGDLAAHFQYDTFGNLLDGRENVTRYQYTGREHDSDTGLNYNRARCYDPATSHQ